MSLHTIIAVYTEPVFPAHAGMSPQLNALGNSSIGFPRSRGDEPGNWGVGGFRQAFSPLTRG